MKAIRLTAVGAVICGFLGLGACSENHQTPEPDVPPHGPGPGDAALSPDMADPPEAGSESDPFGGTGPGDPFGVTAPADDPFGGGAVPPSLSPIDPSTFVEKTYKVPPTFLQSGDSSRGGGGGAAADPFADPGIDEADPFI
ncbi:MAG: hypothetical protein HKN23_20500, partial [Verrucomicrobiales bacterium]|nr:hypothetical protein [Verrucomicrobiales bacterium]